MTDIGKEYKILEIAKRDMQALLVEQYDKEVYYPALKALRIKCHDIGHHPASKIHFNGFGGNWQYCTKCKIRLPLTIHE